jgi:hypothetical protein
MKQAICLIMHKPDETRRNLLQFYSTIREYDVFVVLDDNTDDYRELKQNFPALRFIQIRNEDCMNAGYTNTSFITLRKPVAGWDKAVYFFGTQATDYDRVWITEDDVFFYDETTVKNIDAKYPEHDIVCNGPMTDADLGIWLWKYIRITFPPPYFCGMMCMCRFSRKMLNAIHEYAVLNHTLFFLEALFPTLAYKHQLRYTGSIPELATITHRDKFAMTDFTKTKLYHPVKDLQSHATIRAFLAG